MKVYVVKILQAGDEPWKIFRIYKDSKAAHEMANSLRRFQHDFPSTTVVEYEVY